MCFAMSMVWGMFGCVNNKGSARVESFIRNKFGEIKMENSLLIMEHYYDFTKSDFIRFSTESSPFTYVKGMAYSSIFVPTIDTLRYSFVLDILLNARKNVLILGENGTGKTYLANMIHNLSPRKSRPFFSVNMAEIPETLGELYLFGSVEGCYTGSICRIYSNRKGKRV